MIYKVYFEIFGKKMVTEVDAPNEERAVLKLKDKIKIHKIEPAGPVFTVDELKKVFGWA